MKNFSKSSTLKVFQRHNEHLPNMAISKSLSNDFNTSPTFISLFCGCGGFDLGFIQAGYRCLVAMDFDPFAIETYNKNIGKHGKVVNLKSRKIIFPNKKPDVVLAGPPCQGFSTVGKGRAGDPRNALLPHSARCAVSLDPKFIVIENVLAAKSIIHKKILAKAMNVLENAGYKCSVMEFNACDYGVPQRRRRMMIVAAKRWKSPLVVDKSPVFSLGNILSMPDGLPNQCVSFSGSAFDQLVSPNIPIGKKLSNVRGGSKYISTWNIPKVFGKVTYAEKKVLECIRFLRRSQRTRSFGDADPVSLVAIKKHLGKDLDKTLIKSLIKKGYLKRVGKKYDFAHTFNGKYHRLDITDLSPTVDTKFGQMRLFLHPTEQRAPTVREAARIQGFPDNFVFLGSITSQFRQVGNAVPPPMAKALADGLKKQFSKG